MAVLWGLNWASHVWSCVYTELVRRWRKRETEQGTLVDKDREINELTGRGGGEGKKVVASVYDRHLSNCKTLIGTSHFLKRLSD